MAPSHSPIPVLVPGMELGRYRLLRQLAIGGMAEVHLAQSTGIEGFRKLVVLKRILPQYAHQPSYVRMFLDEARLAGMLHHPNIVQVFDIGSQAGNYYFAMEFVDGQDVRAILASAAEKRERMPLGVALSIAQRICRGLHYAHERCSDSGEPLGIVHRDVSPSNVLVTFDGCTKLLDFGVAKASSHEQETQAGSLKGKIGYMSPEECLGDRVDRRCDIFAIGILLFEMTTGTRLFKGEPELKLLSRIAREDAPSPAERRAGYPEELARIVLKALARDRDARYQTAEELERDLAWFARAERLDDSPIAVAAFLRRLFGRASDRGAPPRRPRGKERAEERPQEPSILIVDAFDEPGTPGAWGSGTGLSDTLEPSLLIEHDEAERPAAGRGRRLLPLAAVSFSLLLAAAAAAHWQLGRDAPLSSPGAPEGAAATGRDETASGRPGKGGATEEEPAAERQGAARPGAAAEPPGAEPPGQRRARTDEGAKVEPIESAASSEPARSADRRERRRRRPQQTARNPRRDGRAGAATGAAKPSERAEGEPASEEPSNWNPDSALLPEL